MELLIKAALTKHHNTHDIINIYTVKLTFVMGTP